LKHDADFEFPLEICYIEDDEKSFFVGDRIAVCRWYWGTKCPPDSASKVVDKIAVLMGATTASAAQKEIIAHTLGKAPTEIRTSTEVIEQVFTKSTFDALHFIGHCSKDNDGMGCLELSDNSNIPLIQIGQLKEESIFSKNRPLVVLNGCATGKPYITLTGKDSFAHRFVQSQAVAFVGTLWPIDETTANRFASLFYQSIKEGVAISEAMLRTKRILAGIGGDPDADALTPAQHLASRIAARSYCLFAHPDLRVLI
jgi:CHAT domain